MTDGEMALAAAAGDRRAEEELLKKYSGLVRKKARGFFLVGGETEDLIQEGMIGLSSAIHTYKQEEGVSFLSYASVCVSRKIIDAVKNSQRRKNQPLNDYVSISDEMEFPSTEDAEENLIRSEDSRAFFRKIGGILSDAEFRIVVLYMEGMSYAEITQATGKNYKSVDNALSRAKKKLAKLQQEDGE